MASPLPELSQVCITLAESPGELCVEFPGGARVCATLGFEIGDQGTISRSFLGALNSAMAPLQPIFNVLDVIKGIFDCLQAIPDCLGPPPDPTALINCLPDLKKKIDALLKLLPTFSVPIMVKALIQVVITSLQGLRADMAALIAQAGRLEFASIRAAELGNVQLSFAVDCENGNMERQLEYLNASLTPTSRLIGLINVFLGLADKDCIRIPLNPLGEISEAVLAPIDAAISFLEGVKAAIPALDIQLPPIPKAEDPC